MNEYIDLLQPEDLIEQIRAAITTIQEAVTSEHNEIDRDTIYFSLEGVRTQIEMLSQLLSQPLEERITGRDILWIVKKLNLNTEQAERLLD